jgi:hypothetical protein
VKVDGVTLKQGATTLEWVGHGYYEIALDAGERDRLRATRPAAKANARTDGAPE